MEARRIVVAGLVTCAIAVAGCNTLSDVRTELGKGGFSLWYPAEGGIEAGQIWQIEGAKRIREQKKPAALEATSGAAKFETLRKSVDASSSLDLDFTNKILGEAGDMGVLLKAGTVKSVALDFGSTSIQRITLGDLRDADVISKLPAGYVTDLKKVQADDVDFVLVGAVVSAAGMKYVFKCDDTTQLQAKAPEIAKAIAADFALKVVSKTEAVWEIPASTPLVIGILPVYGKDLNLSMEEVQRRMALKIWYTDKLLKDINLASKDFQRASQTVTFDDLRW
jgi:hypothetical protein